MATLLERAAKWVKTGLDKTASIEVTIRDGIDAIEALKAIPGQSSFEAFDLDDHVGTSKTFDWIVSEQDLIFTGIKREPKTGWEVWQTLADGRIAVYLVIAQPGSRCFDVTDSLGILLRIHTKLDRIEAA